MPFQVEPITATFVAPLRQGAASRPAIPMGDR